MPVSKIPFAPLKRRKRKGKDPSARQELADFRQSMEALAAKEQEEKIARKIEKLKEKQNRKKEKKANKDQGNMLSAQASAEQQARKEAERLAAIVPGSNVRIKGQTSVGEVMEVNGKNATVAFGSIKTTVKLDAKRLPSSARVRFPRTCCSPRTSAMSVCIKRRSAAKCYRHPHLAGAQHHRRERRTPYHRLHGRGGQLSHGRTPL